MSELDLGRPVLELSVDASKYDPALVQAEQKALKLGSAFIGVGRDLDSLGRSVAKAGGSFNTAFSSDLKANAERIANLTNRMFGDDVIRNANQYAAAVKAVGGASKLTADEQATVNQAVTAALAKYDALGERAPADMRALAAATKAVADPTTALAGRLTDLQGKLQSMGSAATSVGVAWTAGVTAPIIAGLTASAKSAIGFESSFAGIRKTVDGVVDASGNLTVAGKQMQQAMRDLAKEIPVSVDELNRLGESAGALGIPRDEVVEFSKVMAELGVTTNLTADEAADSIARIQNIFGAAGKDTERFASTLVALGNAGASTERDIVSMATRIAGAGHTVGMSQGEVLAFASALSSVGIEAEAGGSAISKVFIDIAKAVRSGGQDLETFARVAGVSTAAFKQAFAQDAAGAVTSFIEGLGRIQKSGGDLFGTLDQLGLSEIRVRDAMLRVAGAGDLVRASLKLQGDAWRENTALSKEAQQRFETTEQQLVKLWNRIRDVGITLGNALLPGIKAAIDTFTLLLPVLDTLAKVFAALPGSAQLVVIGIAGVTAAIGPALILFGQMAQGVATLIGLFGKKELAARLLSGELVTLQGAAAAGARALSGLGIAAGAAAAGFVGWQVGRVIADLFDLDRKIADSIIGLQNLTTARQLAAGGKGAEAEADVQARLVVLERQRTQAIQEHNLAGAALLATQIENLKHDQTRLAIQDSINLAIKRGADATITYTEAVKFNADWAQKQAEAHKGAAAATAATGKAAQDAGAPVSALIALNAKYAEDLQKIGTSGFKEIRQAHEVYGQSVKDLSEKYGVAESSIQRYFDGVQKAAAATKVATKASQEATSAIDQFGKKADELEKALQSAARVGVPMSIVLEEFGTAITDVTNKAPIFGKSIGDATKAAAEALKSAELKKSTVKLVGDLNDEARKLVDGWKKVGEESGQKLTEGLAKSNKRFLDEAAALQKQLVSGEKDSLEKRLELIRLEFDERRRALNVNGSRYQEQLWALNADEADALEEGTQKWREEGEKRKDAMVYSLNGLSQAFANLSQIAGDAFGGIVKDIAQMVGALALSVTAARSLSDSIAALGKKGGNTAANWTNLATSGAATAAGMWQSTSPDGKSTGANVAGGALSWGATGATIGANPALMAASGGSSVLVGAIVGATAGALVSWWRSSHQQWRAIGEQVGEWLGAPISEKLAKQIDEVRKTLEGGTKKQRQEWAASISLPDIIAEQGGLRADNVETFEAQASGLFEIIQRGGANAKKAYETLNTLVGQFAGYADSAGGVWDETFKDLIAQSKALGINLEAVNTALNAQIASVGTGVGQFLSNASISDQAGAGAIGDLLGGTYAAMRAQGASARESLAALQPQITAFNKQLAETGLTGGDAFGAIANLAGIAGNEISGKALDAINGLSTALVGAQNAGFLTQSMFTGLTGEILKQRDAILATGASSDDVNALMQKDLQRIWELQHDFNYKVDEGTQAMLDEAAAAGTVGNQYRSAMDRAALAMERVADALDKVLGKTNAVSDAVQRIPTSKTIGIDVVYKDNGYRPDDPKPEPTPGTPRAPDFDGDDGRRSSTEYHARGGVVGRAADAAETYRPIEDLLGDTFKPKGTDTIPAVLTRDEGIVNVQAMRRLDEDGLDALNAGEPLPPRLLPKLFDAKTLARAAAIAGLIAAGPLAQAHAAATSGFAQGASSAPTGTLSGLLGARDLAAEQRLRALQSGAADDTADPTSPAGRMFGGLDDALTRATRGLLDFAGAQRAALVNARNTAADARLEALLSGRADDTAGPDTDQGRLFRQLDDALTQTTRRLTAATQGLPAAGFQADGTPTPGVGSDAGAFVQLPNGQFVPTNHPLYRKALDQAAAARKPLFDYAAIGKTARSGGLEMALPNFDANRFRSDGLVMAQSSSASLASTSVAGRPDPGGASERTHPILMDARVVGQVVLPYVIKEIVRLGLKPR